MTPFPKNGSTPSPGLASGSNTRSAASIVGEAPGAGANRRVLTVAAVGLVVVGLDQLTKWWALESLSDGPIDLVWTLRLRLIRNFGGSFGLNEGRGAAISIIGLVVVCGLLAMARKPRPTMSLVALGCFAGGAIGNIVDRVLRNDSDQFFGGGVVDFIDFQWWPVFNVADVSLFVGVALLLVFGLEADAPAPESGAGDDG